MVLEVLPVLHGGRLQLTTRKDFGVYDDRIIFTMGGETGGRYSYNPGEDGKMYVNKGYNHLGNRCC